MAAALLHPTIRVSTSVSAMRLQSMPSKFTGRAARRRKSLLPAVDRIYTIEEGKGIIGALCLICASEKGTRSESDENRLLAMYSAFHLGSLPSAMQRQVPTRSRKPLRLSGLQTLSAQIAIGRYLRNI